MCQTMEFIQHFEKWKSPSTRSTIFQLCGLHFPTWQMEIMITASLDFIYLDSPLFCCSFSHPSFMVRFCSFSLPILHPSLPPSFFVCIFSLFLTTSFFPLSISVSLIPHLSGPSTIKSMLWKSKRSTRQRKSVRKPISREMQLLMWASDKASSSLKCDQFHLNCVIRNFHMFSQGLSSYLHETEIIFFTP